MPRFYQFRLSFNRIFGIKRPLNEFIRLHLVLLATDLLLAKSMELHHV